jgi:hypothetical protein
LGVLAVIAYRDKKVVVVSLCVFRAASVDELVLQAKLLPSAAQLARNLQSRGGRRPSDHHLAGVMRLWLGDLPQ